MTAGRRCSARVPLLLGIRHAFVHRQLTTHQLLAVLYDVLVGLCGVLVPYLELTDDVHLRAVAELELKHVEISHSFVLRSDDLLTTGEDARPRHLSHGIPQRFCDLLFMLPVYAVAHATSHRRPRVLRTGPTSG